jgi:pyruvate/2-oxoglutarate dehydrogenase complex dihydrolipoamide acyltransferase (E2) component
MIDDDIYHSTVLVSNLGSIECDAIYHNLTNFGTSSFVVTIGEIHRQIIVNAQGEPEARDVCHFGANCDERIADGFYLVQSINMLKHILANPELLEQPMGQHVPVGSGRHKAQA